MCSNYAMDTKGKWKRAKKLIAFWAKQEARCRPIPLFCSYALNMSIIREGERIRKSWNHKNKKLDKAKYDLIE